MMLVLGDVGEMREVAEGPHDLHRLIGRQIVQDGLQRAPGRLVIVAMEADRRLPNALHDIEDRVTLLLADGVAEDAPEQPDIVAQRLVLLGARTRDDLVHIRDLS